MHRNTPAGKDVMNDIVPFLCRPSDKGPSVTMKYIHLRQSKILLSKLVNHGINFDGGDIDAEFVQRFCSNPNTKPTTSITFERSLT